MLLNRRLKNLDKLNPDVSIIRKTSPANIERGWGYIKLLLQKTNLQNSSTETWLNSKYHLLEEKEFIQSMDTRPIAAGLIYIGGIIHGEDIPKKTILQIMKPLAANTLNGKIKDLKIWLNL